MTLVLLSLVLRLLVTATSGHLVIGPTYAAAEWNCGGEYNCYVVIGHVPGEEYDISYEIH